MILAGCCFLISRAALPQTLVVAGGLALGLLLPLNHQSGGESGSQSDESEEETEELHPRAGHRRRRDGEEETCQNVKKKKPVK